MKNIHLISTDKPSRLHEFGGTWFSYKEPSKSFRNYKMYITNDEEIKEGDWIIQINFENTNTQSIQCITEFQVKIANDKNGSFTKNKVILTTDQDLINDGVQPIDDEFLEWFCSKNGEVDFVKVITTEDEKN
jgi:hypothetical protein